MNPVTLNKERLIQCRKVLGITKQEAAKRMGMSQPAYLRYESGERTPSIHVVHTMAEVLETSVEYLLGKTDLSVPNSYTIKFDSDPELFLLIEYYKNSDKNTKDKMLAYIQAFEEK